MALPKIQTPTFTLKLPSNNKKIVYRQFTVKEEKMLLIAQQSDDDEDRIRTIKHVLQNCIVEPQDYDVSQMPSFDIEYFFLKLRAKSVGEVVTLKISPQERDDLPAQKVKINLDEIEPYIDENHQKLIDIDGDIKLEMRYPRFEDISSIGDTNNPEELFDLFTKCVNTIYEGETAYPASDHTKEEIDEFLEQLSAKQLEKIQTFFTTMPKIRTSVEYNWKSEDGKDSHKETIEIEGLMNFLS